MYYIVCKNRYTGTIGIIGPTSNNALAEAIVANNDKLFPDIIHTITIGQQTLAATVSLGLGLGLWYSETPT